MPAAERRALDDVTVSNERIATMLLAYLVLVLACAVLTARLVKRRSRHAVTAAVATILAMIAVPTGFTIGIYLAALAAVLAIAAGSRGGPSRHVA